MFRDLHLSRKGGETSETHSDTPTIPTLYCQVGVMFSSEAGDRWWSSSFRVGLNGRAFGVTRKLETCWIIHWGFVKNDCFVDIYCPSMDVNFQTTLRRMVIFLLLLSDF